MVARTIFRLPWDGPVRVLMVNAAIVMLSGLGYTIEFKDTCLSDYAYTFADSFDFSGTPEDDVSDPKFFRNSAKRACVTSAYFEYVDNENINLIDALQEECNAKVRDAFLLDWPFNMNIYYLGFHKPEVFPATDRFVNARHFSRCNITSTSGVKRLSCFLHVGSKKHPTYEIIRCNYELRSNKWKSGREHKKCVTGEGIAHQLVNYVSTPAICLRHTAGHGIVKQAVEFLNCTRMPKRTYFGLCVYPPFKCNRMKKFLTKERNYFGCEICSDDRIGDFCHRYRHEPCKDLPCRHLGTCTSVGSSYTCSCISGRYGNHCQYVRNVCRKSPCKNDGTCVPTADNSVTCRCKAGFAGVLCEKDIDECVSNPCLNGGQCLNEPGQFRCSCPSSFNGIRCENNIDDCAVKPCSAEGTVKCVDLTGTFRCMCKPRYTGFLCDQVVDACASSPCENGGTCVKLKDGLKCLCPKGYTGTICSGAADPCLMKPCQNGGTCSASGSAYKCTCAMPFTGKHCEIKRLLCQPGSCNLGTCVDGELVFKCTCPPGFTGPTCGFNVDDCRGIVCQHGGICTDEINGFHCKCTRFWEGKFCHIRRGPCKLENNCMNNSTCREEADDYRCDCPEGLAGRYCDESAAQRETQSKGWFTKTVAALLIVALVLFLLLLAVAFLYHSSKSGRRNQRRYHLTHTPKKTEKTRDRRVVAKRSPGGSRDRMRQSISSSSSSARSYWKWPIVAHPRLKNSITRIVQAFGGKRARQSERTEISMDSSSGHAARRR